MQEIILYVLIFVSGLFFGSFFNLVADRIVKGKSILFGRSECESCGMKLGINNLIPFFSYVLQRGKCSNCKVKLSLYYPLSEILSGLLFVLAAYTSGVFYSTFSMEGFFYFAGFIYYIVIFSTFLILFLTDMKYRLIPNKIINPAIIFSIIFELVVVSILIFYNYNALKTDPFGQYYLQAGWLHQIVISTSVGMLYTFLSALGLAGFFVFLILITKGKGMGGGDVPLVFLIGLFNKFPENIIAVFTAFLIGAIYSLVLLVLKKKKMKDAIPFGPFLIIGSFIAFFWGRQLLEWYTNLL